MTTTALGAEKRAAAPEASAFVDGTILELKLTGDIAGSFSAARYQRGYHWPNTSRSSH